MRKITDDDLTLLYYGEHEDPALAVMVAESEELSARYDALCAELKLADAWLPPQRGDDYGAEVWQRISPQLSADETGFSVRLRAWLASFATSSAASSAGPRFSLAGALSLVLVATLAFTLGRNGGQEVIKDAHNANNPGEVTNLAMADIDSDRLLSHSVAAHLEQVNLMLTQFVNTTETSPETNPNQAGYATDMLVANRLYRQAAVTQGNHRLAAFLADLEPLLIELAYEAQSGSPKTRERMQQEVKDGLLFRVRVMNNQLSKPQISV